MGYTLEQLQKMGATPVAPKRGYTADELKKLGAKPLNFQETPEPKETTWGTIKSIAKELPGAMKTVATAPFKNPVKTTQAVVAGAGDVGVGIANLGLKLSGSKTRLPSLTKAFAESQTNEKDQDLYTALGEGTKMYSSFALGQKSVDKFVKNPVARGVLGNVVGGQATMDADATAKERGTQSLFDAAFGLVTEGVGPLARRVFKKAPVETPAPKPKLTHEEYAQAQGYEPIVPDDALPVIKAGKTPKEKVVKYGKDNPKVFDDGITASDGQPPIPTKTSLQDKAQMGETSVESPLISEAKKYKSAEEFVKATPKTVKVWNKSKFSNDGAYADIPVTKKVDNVTLYQGGKTGDGRQFWTSDKKYASQFGEVKEKTGSFYKVDNGNRVTDVYVEAPTKSQLTNMWNKANNGPTYAPAMKKTFDETIVEKANPQFIKEVEDTTERVFKDMPDYNGTTQVRQTAAYKDLMDQGKEDYVLDVASKRIKDPNLNEGAAYKLLEDHYKTTKQYEKILELGKTARPLNEAGQTLSMGNMGDGADGPAIMIGKAIEAKRTALAKRGINVDKEISSYFDESFARLKKGEAWDNISDDLINFLTCK